MTILLLLATFAVFLTIDYVRKEKTERVSQNAETTLEGTAAPPRMLPNYVSGFALPENYRYHPGHTWAMQESPALVRVGLDDFAARLAGKIESVHLPKRGQWVRQGQKLATIRREGQTAELVSPVEGEVTNVNEALLTNPALACSDPYGEGWLISVFSPDTPTNFRNLLGGELARCWMAEAASRLQAKFPVLAGAVAQDGGVAVQDLTAELAGQEWNEVAGEFFLT